MRESICNVFAPEQTDKDVRIAHFVYETQWQKLQQPFLPLIHYLHIVTAGSGTLLIGEQQYKLQVGSIFFAFPVQQYQLRGTEDFSYVYISFMGNGIPALLEQMQISPRFPVYDGYHTLCDIFLSTIQNSRSQNASVLAHGLLLYTLGRLAPSPSQEGRMPQQVFANIVDYVDKHYTEPDLSLKTLAKISSYTEKYVSALFIKNMEVSFLTYLTNLRMQKASQLLSARAYTVSQVAQLSGFADPLYFSKVFKKHTGWTPTEFMHEMHLWREEP